MPNIYEPNTRQRGWGNKTHPEKLGKRKIEGKNKTVTTKEHACGKAHPEVVRRVYVTKNTVCDLA